MTKILDERYFAHVGSKTASLRIPMRRFHDNSSAIMNKRNATPNSAMGAICPTSVMETAESQDTSLARAPRPNGPRTTPAARNPKTGLNFSRPNSGTITPAVARNRRREVDDGESGR